MGNDKTTEPCNTQSCIGKLLIFSLLYQYVVLNFDGQILNSSINEIISYIDAIATYERTHNNIHNNKVTDQYSTFNYNNPNRNDDR